VVTTEVVAGGGLAIGGLGAGLEGVEEGEEVVDVWSVVGEGVLLGEVAVICAKDEVGRINDRKSSVEENGNDREHPQDGLDRRLESILTNPQK